MHVGRAAVAGAAGQGRQGPARALRRPLRRCSRSLLCRPGTGSGPLFLAARYGRLHPGVRLRPNGLKQLLRRLGRAAGVPRVHAHRFRHTFATWAIAHDARELDVQHLLGHSSPDMVRRYSATYGSAQAAQRHAAFSPGDGMLA
ncbi:MAG: site-specific integrase [Chloroflexi bacterium]|nr:site-specific integrase [Chloroflexota bacterium]